MVSLSAEITPCRLAVSDFEVDIAESDRDRVIALLVMPDLMGRHSLNQLRRFDCRDEIGQLARSACSGAIARLFDVGNNALRPGAELEAGFVQAQHDVLKPLLADLRVDVGLDTVPGICRHVRG